MTTDPTRSIGNPEFDTTHAAHADCTECADAADYAAVMARATGSTGGTVINGDHRATVKRARCLSRRADCRCAFCE